MSPAASSYSPAFRSPLVIAVAVAQEVNERAACATAFDHLAADQQARNLTLQIRPLVVALVFVPLVRLVPSLAARADQLREQRATHSAPSQDAAPHYEAQELAVPIAAFLAAFLTDLVVVLFALISSLTPVADELRE